MSTYGKYSPYPRTYGGGRNVFEIEHAALLDSLADLYDPSEETASYAELYAHALAVYTVWRLNRRLTAQALPASMLENLTTWEEACKLRPTDADKVQARRARVAAKLRGLSDNTITGIEDSCRALLGQAFEALRTVAPGDEITYWPGVNPGPPGYEWSSSRAAIAVVVKRLGLDAVAFADLIARTYQMVDAMAPAWMSFQVGTNDGGFVVGEGIVGLTLL